MLAAQGRGPQHQEPDRAVRLCRGSASEHAEPVAAGVLPEGQRRHRRVSAQ
ncbi:hypothetical protein [Pseudonocardia sp.]|uniref:hypothetical protein n=1 Tax=Pseudonocardia sp. TaxID=60912 RepID=UPI0031FD6AC4